MRGSGRRQALVFAVVLGGIGGTGSPARADDPLDKSPFTATAEELLAAAKAAPAGDWPVVILREEDDRTVGVDGRVVRRWRTVFVVRSQAGVDGWGTVSTTWSPFYQDRPAVKARIVAPGAKVAQLDQTLITDAPTTEKSATVFSDTRRLRAPLPRLQVGAVVEQEIVTTDRNTLLEAGSVETVIVGNSVPTLSTRITLSAPVKRAAALRARGLPKAARAEHRKAKDLEVWTYQLDRLDPAPDEEAWIASDSVARPYVGLATAPSWAAVAQDYRKIVDKSIADGAVTLADGLPKTATLDTVAAIVRWLHEHVRYTGIEFGEASNVPWPPAETSKRGFGDCKDKATLLVALLREAGIAADLVLLWTGPGPDIDRQLPGMGVFDHAIVLARVGKRDVWIDATEDLVQVGSLPARDQGRLALVIADGTRDLRQTPLAAPGDNTVHETRTFELSETSSARMTEVSREGGVFEAGMRAWIRDTQADDVKKGLAEYARTEYHGELERHATTDARDLATPMEVTTVVAHADRALTVRDRIDIYLYPRSVLTKLPDLLTDEPDASAPPRASDFEWYRPHVYEIENRLVLPPGYKAPPLQPDRVLAVGSATFTERDRLDGSSVVVTFRFDSGKRRIKPAELTAMQTAIRALAKEERHIVVEHTGWALSVKGKPREAITEIQRLIALHPKEAVHHAELAQVLLRAGMGDAARRAARKAIAVEPTSADAYVVLGWVLHFDTLGREYGFDHDRAGAIAAYRKARKLDPKHVGAAAELAALLARGANGRPYDVGSDAKAAAAEWRAALALSDTTETAQSLMAALMFAGELEDAETFARTRTPSLDRDAIVVAAVAARRGASAANDAAGALRAGAERTRVIDKAAATLMAMRRYDEARGLYALTGSVRAGSDQGVMIARAKRHDRLAAPGKDPRWAVENAYVLAIDAGRKPKVFWDARAEEDIRKELAAQTAPGSEVASVGFFVDLLVSSLDLKTEGDPGGPWRVEASTLGKKFVLYVALDGRIAKIIGSPSSPDGVGRVATRLLADGGDKQAARLLDWLQQDAAGLSFTAVWGPKLKRDRQAIALAAAIVAADSLGDKTLPILTDCKSEVPAARTVCDRMLAAVYARLERWKPLLEHATAWASRQPIDPMAVMIQAGALIKLGRFDEADKLLDGELAKHPDDPGTLRLRVQVAVARGQLDEAIKRGEPLTASPNPAPLDLNNAAWLHVVVGRDLPGALALAEKAAGLAKDDPMILNTLGVIRSELGDLRQAMTDGLNAMAARHSRRPEDADLYLIGRVAEQLGLRDDAIAAYRGIAKGSNPSDPQAAYALAGTRLAALGAKR